MKIIPDKYMFDEDDRRDIANADALIEKATMKYQQTAVDALAACRSNGHVMQEFEGEMSLCDVCAHFVKFKEGEGFYGPAVTMRCKAEPEQIDALCNKIVAAKNKGDPVEVRRLAQGLERAAFRWYLKTDTGEAA